MRMGMSNGQFKRGDKYDGVCEDISKNVWRRPNSKCRTKPLRSMFQFTKTCKFTTANTCNWACKEGFVQSDEDNIPSEEGTECVKIPDCKPGEILNKTMNVCDTCDDDADLEKPAILPTPIFATGYVTKGYFQRGQNCEPKLDTCGIGQTLNGEQNRCDPCSNLPEHAEFTTANTCDWVCNKGYFQRGDTCEDIITECDGIGQRVEENRCKTCPNLPKNAEFTTVNAYN